MEKFITATGKTIDLAIAAALEELHMDRDSVSVEVLENPSRTCTFRVRPQAAWQV